MNETECAEARAFLGGLSIADLRALDQVLGPAVEAGHAGRRSTDLFGLIEAEIDQREHEAAA